MRIRDGVKSGVEQGVREGVWGALDQAVKDGRIVHGDVHRAALASKDAEIERLTGVLHRLSQFHGGSDDVRQVTKQVRQIAKAGLEAPNQAAGATPQPRSEVSGSRDTAKPFRRS